MPDPKRHIILRDSTLREAMDTPGVWFDRAARREIAAALDRLGVAEAEVVAPSRVEADLEEVVAMRDAAVGLRLSGLIYASSPGCRGEVEQAAARLDRIDLLVPLSARREPTSRQGKVSVMLEALSWARQHFSDVGVGFPHSSQSDGDFVIDIAGQATAAGAGRITFYDTNGSAEPFGVRQIVGRLVGDLDTTVLFHGHNDLGLATANSLAAVLAGATVIDATVNGLGDRAGNASLEQVAVLLEREGFETGIDLSQLRPVSEMVAEKSGVPVSGLAPVVGDYAFDHRSPSHLAEPAEFEAFTPELVGEERRLRKAPAGTYKRDKSED
ncbi:MAG: homocitrate synthase [Nitrospirae bacterium]|nr:homocitrate synthase [Nitrospirota bacterium]